MTCQNCNRTFEWEPGPLCSWCANERIALMLEHSERLEALLGQAIGQMQQVLKLL